MIFHCLEEKNKETDWRLREIQSERKERRNCIALHFAELIIDQWQSMPLLPRRNDREPKKC